jgi:hypothetical protein
MLVYIVECRKLTGVADINHLVSICDVFNNRDSANRKCSEMNDKNAVWDGGGNLYYSVSVWNAKD